MPMSDTRHILENEPDIATRRAVSYSSSVPQTCRRFGRPAASEAALRPDRPPPIEVALLVRYPRIGMDDLEGRCGSEQRSRQGVGVDPCPDMAFNTASVPILAAFLQSSGMTISSPSARGQRPGRAPRHPGALDPGKLSLGQGLVNGLNGRKAGNLVASLDAGERGNPQRSARQGSGPCPPVYGCRPALLPGSCCRPSRAPQRSAGRHWPRPPLPLVRRNGTR